MDKVTQRILIIGGLVVAVVLIGTQAVVGGELPTWGEVITGLGGLSVGAVVKRPGDPTV